MSGRDKSSADAPIAVCIMCNCTDVDACVSNGRPCGWVIVNYEANIGLCSSCYSILRNLCEGLTLPWCEMRCFIRASQRRTVRTLRSESHSIKFFASLRRFLKIYERIEASGDDAAQSMVILVSASTKSSKRRTHLLPSALCVGKEN